LRDAGATEVDGRPTRARIGERARAIVTLADRGAGRAAAPIGYADLIPATSAAKRSSAGIGA
jgi:hypothetical protein